MTMLNDANIGIDAMRRQLLELHEQVGSLEAQLLESKQTEQALLQREKELVDFVENAVEGLHRVGPDGTILWANRAELKMLGYQWDEYVGRHIAEFHVDAPVIDCILKTLTEGGTLYDHPARLHCKDGTIKHVLIHSNGCFEDGELRYTRCFTRDATEREALQASYAERGVLLEELTQANQVKDDFLALLGHELRNPLSPIVTALELMRMRGDPSTHLEQGIIRRQVEHMTRLVDDLLDVSRITRGTIDLHIEQVDIGQVLVIAMEMAAPLFEKRSHQLSVNVEPSLFVDGDAARLAQVFANLLTNAARYTDVGGHIWLSARHNGRDSVRIGVRDNGIGIETDMLECIFKPFIQGKRGIDRKQGGLGIGLALVQNIVKLHSGYVEVTSQGKGHGSEFAVSLPVSNTPKNAGNRTPEVEFRNLAPGPTQRIMIVDDNVDAAETLGRMFQMHGHAVKIFNEPTKALNEVSSFLPQVAILDIGLPGLDGYELATSIRSRLMGNPCRLIALSGYGQRSDKTKSKIAGFELHLVKPVQHKELFQWIANKLGSSE